MGFSAELRGFAEGFGRGVDIGNTRASRRYTEAATDRLRQQIELAKPYSDAAGGAIPDPFGNDVSAGVTTSSETPGAQAGSTSAMPNRAGAPFNTYIYNYYRSKGLSHPHAAGIVANIDIESGGGDPRVISGARRGDKGTAAYVGQWRGSRQDNLMRYAGGQPSLQQQLDFYLEEGNPKSKYAEAGAIKAHQLAAAAKTPAEATQYIMQFFERPSSDPKVNHIGRRIQTANSLSDEYTGKVGTSPFGAGGDFGAGASTEEAGDEGFSEGLSPGQRQRRQEEEPQAAELPEASFELPGVELPELADWTEFARLAMVERPPAEPPPAPSGASALDMDAIVEALRSRGVEAPARPAMFAAKGGVVQRFADGGTPVDPYNPRRAYTQPLPAAPTSTWRPRRVGMPTGGVGTSGTPATVAPGTPSSSQLALRKAQSDLTAKRASDKAAADAAAKAAADAAAAKKPTRQTTTWRPHGRGSAEYQREWEKAVSKGDYATAQAIKRHLNAGTAAGGYNTGGGSDDGGYGGGPGTRSVGGGLYAEGGIVTVDPEYWEEILTAESGAAGGGDAQEVRDRAARRINRERRGVSSTAIRIGKKGAEIKRKAREKRAAGPEKKAGAPAPQQRLPDLSRNPYDVQQQRLRPGEVPANVGASGAIPDDGGLPGRSPRLPRVSSNEPLRERFGYDTAAAPVPRTRGITGPPADRDWYMRNEPAISGPEVPAPVMQLPRGLPRELRADPGAKVVIDGQTYTRDPSGRLVRSVEPARQSKALEGRPATPESPRPHPVSALPQLPGELPSGACRAGGRHDPQHRRPDLPARPGRQTGACRHPTPLRATGLPAWRACPGRGRCHAARRPPAGAVCAAATSRPGATCIPCAVA